MGQGDQDGTLSVTYSELAFQAADNVLGLLTLARCEQLRNDGHFLVL